MSIVLRVLIADDEEPARDRLRSVLTRMPMVELVAEADDGDQVCSLYWKHKPQVMLLDIRMPGLSGIDLAELMANERDHVGIVFVSAYDQYAVDAFELDVDDYVTKPIRPNRLEKALAKVRTRLQHKSSDTQPKRLAMPLRDRLEFLSFDDLVHAKFVHGNVEIHSLQRLYHVPWSLAELEQRLSGSSQFVKVSRQALVNLNHLESLESQDSGTSLLHMRGGAQIEASRSATRLIKSKY